MINVTIRPPKHRWFNFERISWRKKKIMIILCNIKLDTFATVLNLHLHVSEQITMELYKIYITINIEKLKI